VEGVETAEQLALVKSMGAHEVQGYYYSKPLAVKEIKALLRRGRIVPVRRVDRRTVNRMTIESEATELEMLALG
jgi:predicted signal transduction protein with EAL and GGDEF domain